MLFFLSIRHFRIGDQYLLSWYSRGLRYMFDPCIMKTVKPNCFRFLFCPIFIMLINRPWLPQHCDSLVIKVTSTLQAISWRHTSMVLSKPSLCYSFWVKASHLFWASRMCLNHVISIPNGMRNRNITYSVSVSYTHYPTTFLFNLTRHCDAYMLPRTGSLLVQAIPCYLLDAEPL